MTPDVTLEVENLNVAFWVNKSLQPVVRDVSFSVRRGETLALVGESGSGKSVTSLAMLRLTPPPPHSVVEGRVNLRRKDGKIDDLLSLNAEGIRDVRGSEIAMIFQEPMTSLNPVFTIGNQIIEAIRCHGETSSAAANRRAAELLDLVGIPEARKRLHSYPHHLSGGMRQRAMIAMALSCEPKVLIADEPTTALDVTVQAQILELLKDLQRRTEMSVIFITHDMGVVAEVADRVMVMYAGRIVEEAGVVPLFTAPRMPYTMGLLHSVPRMDMAGRHGAVLEAIPGTVPDPAQLPSGCAFQPRCAYADPERCAAAVPALEHASGDHLVRCIRWNAIRETAS